MLFLSLLFQLSSCSRFSVKQSSQELIIPFDSLNLSISNYYQVTLKLTSGLLLPALLTARSSSPPSASSVTEVWTIEADKHDYNSWVSSSRVHYLFLDSSAVWYLGVYVYSLNSSLTWDLEVLNLSIF